MPRPLPALLVAGFGGPGRKLVIDALLRHRPAQEQWALIAPAGLLGGASYGAEPTSAGLWLQTVAPGCPCCTGLTPFSAGLTALLRKLRDQPVSRLLIEGGSEGHIDSVARLLQRDEFSPHVVLAHALAVIDPAWLGDPKPAAQEALRALAHTADSLVAAPWEQSAAAHAAFDAFARGLTPPKPWSVLTQDMLDAGHARALLHSTSIKSAA